MTSRRSLAQLLMTNEFIAFTTRDFAAATGRSVAAASSALARLSTVDTAFVRICRGVWANTSHPYFDPRLCVFPLLRLEQGYVSFLTALFDHGALSQIPTSVQVATTGKPRVVSSPVATFEFFRVDARLHHPGVDSSQTHVPYRCASIEKALFDTICLSTQRGNRFARLPELDLEAAGFNARVFEELVSAYNLPTRLLRALRRRYDALG